MGWDRTGQEEMGGVEVFIGPVFSVSFFLDEMCFESIKTIFL